MSHIPEFTRNTALTIGNFDGLHRGHMSLIRRLIEEASARSLHSVMITFEPHPMELLSPEHRIRRICDLPEIRRILSNNGPDTLVRLPFTAAMASMDPETFWTHVIRDRFAPRYIVVGQDHTFGKNRQGTPEFLQAVGRRDHIDVDVFPQVYDGDEPVSSTRIRALISDGHIDRVRQLLGHGLYYTGTVVHGDGIGATLGFPTANIRLPGRMLPPSGVFVSRTEVNDTWLPSISYLGRAPTFNGRDLTLETHIFHLDRMLYTCEITVDLLAMLRGDMTFESPDALIRQIRTDIAAANRWLDVDAGHDDKEDGACV
ncbi:MAG TPA: riboflavin biosynthesis protein RibF [bacterium]|nr:riboflavin biosynthesis protein RibF [bacterium]